MNPGEVMIDDLNRRGTLSGAVITTHDGLVQYLAYNEDGSINSCNDPCKEFTITIKAENKP